MFPVLHLYSLNKSGELHALRQTLGCLANTWQQHQCIGLLFCQPGHTNKQVDIFSVIYIFWITQWIDSSFKGYHEYRLAQYKRVVVQNYLTVSVIITEYSNSGYQWMLIFLIQSCANVLTLINFPHTAHGLHTTQHWAYWESRLSVSSSQLTLKPSAVVVVKDLYRSWWWSNRYGPGWTRLDYD